MNEQPTDRSGVAEPPVTTEQPRIMYGYFLGVLAGVTIALAYGLSAELVGLTYGLPVVGLVGGWAIGTAIAYGAWGEQDHVPSRALRVGAVVIALVSWLLGMVVAYIVSQALIPEATKSLLERIAPGGFLEYALGAFDFVRLLHLTAVALLAFMAWRAAR